MALEHIVAAATRIITRKKAAASRSAGLQVIAWDLFDSVPEVGTYADWVSNAMGGARLFAGRQMPDGTVAPLKGESRASQLVGSIAGGTEGQSELLGNFGTNLAVAGEAWLVIVPNPDSDSFAEDKWYVLSTDEVKPQRGKITATVDGEEVVIPEPKADTEAKASDPVAIRVWKPSPRRQWDATSPVIRAITVLEELRLLNAAVAAIARSRITGRGVLLVPAGTRFPGTGNQAGKDDSLLDTFIEVASTAIREPESAAATVPIVLEVPGDLISGVKWLQFTSEFDALAIQLRDEAIRRFAVGADVPAEVLLGLGDTNHWSAWALTAEALKMGAEPRLKLVCHALTEEWLRPVLLSEGEPDANEIIVWFDTSAVRSSSNKAASALEGFKVNLIGGPAARRELGFTEADAPTATKTKTEDAPQRREELPVSDTQTTPDTEPGADTLTASERHLLMSSAIYPPTSEPTASLAPALTAAVDGMVWAALSVAGQKILRTPACPRPQRGSARELLATANVHTRHPVAFTDIEAWRLLDDAWLRVPEVAERYGVDAAVLTAALNGYVSALLVSAQPHTYDNVTRMLAQSGILPSTLIGMVKDDG